MSEHAVGRPALREYGRADRHAGRPHRGRTGHSDNNGHTTGGWDGNGPASHDGWPLWLAVTVTVLLAVVLTWLGMVTQIWANLTGAQLPGA